MGENLMHFSTEVGIRHQKHHYDVIMTSFHNIGHSKFHILWNIIQAISLPSFIGLGCLDKILRLGWKTPLPSPSRFTCSEKAQSL